MSEFSTIAAISTPFGKGGIAVIRISGDDAIAIACRMFRPASGRALSQAGAREAVYGSILHGSEIIDSGIATLFRAPASFTGEDTVEICCHGGILLTRKVLESAFLCGAVPAGPGEFTKRAFLNGKLHLTEAEGVIDLIEAESEEQLGLAVSQSRGRLSTEISKLSSELRALLASVYAYIDYPDEDLTDVPVQEMQARISALIARVARLRGSYASGKAIKEGIRTALVGKPNTGKSSILNLLLGEDRAIVTDIPGTTRDTVEESASLGRVMLRLCDTAGIRRTDDPVERLGVTRSMEKLQDAELIFGVFDGSAALDAEDAAVLELLGAARARGCEVILLCNKTDRGCVLTESDFPSEWTVLPISVKENGAAALDALRQAVETRYLDGTISLKDDAVVTSARQFASLCAAEASLKQAKEALDAGLTQDLAGMDLEEALSRLLETDGRAAASGIVDEIFSRFCVGK